MENLIKRHLNRMQTVDMGYVRQMMYDIDWTERMVMIKGQRGVGKTTLMLQRIMQTFGQTNITDVLYVSLDNIYFNSHQLLELVEQFHAQGGRYLFLDEVHTYQGWSKEVKNAYDEFTDMHFVLSGSSLVNLSDGEADLSRRCITYTMQGLSFREYLGLFRGLHFPRLSLHDILTDGNKTCAAVNALTRPLPLFADYLEYGYYPFLKEGKNNYHVRLENIVNMTIETELPHLRRFDIANVRKMKSLLAVIASSVPFVPDTVKLAGMAGIARNTLLQYLQHLSDARMLLLLYADNASVKRLQKPDKVYLENTNLLHTLTLEQVNKGNVRETFFVNQVAYQHNVEYSRTAADFTVDRRYTIEVGGQSKDGKQVAGVDAAFIAADGEEYVLGNKIPLWLFGFLY